MASTTKSGQPSSYPTPWTYLVLSTSLIFSAVSTGLLGYFTYYLNLDSMSVPWEFLLLLATSSLTLIANATTILIHLRRPARLPAGPRTLTVIHGVLLLPWIIGTAYLGQKIGPMVLGHACDIATWQTDDGVMVCHIYKALFAFLVLSAAAVLAALALDITVWLGGNGFDGGRNRGEAYREIGGEKTRSSTGGFGFGFGLKQRARTWRERGVGYEGTSTASEAGVGGIPATLQPRTMGGRGLREPPLPSPGYSDGGDMGDSERLMMGTPDLVSRVADRAMLWIEVC